jgi:tripartite-type tricarboxylate transporter receptor subunit TctC
MNEQIEARSAKDMRLSRILLALGVAVLVSIDAQAQAQDYPARTIKIVVPYPAGGPTDLVGRTAAEALSKALKQSVVVENKAGAGGTIGSDSVVKAAPDGYTFLLGLMGPMSIAPKIARNLPYDPLKDLAPVRLVAIMPEILVARPSLGLRTLADVVAYAKANPAKLTIASAGNGSLPHLAAELLKRETGITAVHVPYRGAAPAVNDMLGDHVDLMFGDGPVVLPQIAAKLLTPIVLASGKRMSVLPDLATSAEQGFPSVRSENWYGVLAPKGTPRAIVDTIDKALASSLADAKIVENFSNLGVSIVNEGTPETFAIFLAAQLENWGGLAKEAGVKME